MKGRLPIGQAATLYAGLVGLLFVVYGLGIVLGRGHLLESSPMAVPPSGVSSPVENVTPQLDFYEGLSTPVAPDPNPTVGSADPAVPESDSVGQARGVAHTVQVGAYRGRPDMQRMLLRLEAKGYTSRISEASESDPFYRIWVGAFRSFEEAEQMENSLRDDGFPTFVKTIPVSP